MYTSLRRRSREVLKDLCDAFDQQVSQTSLLLHGYQYDQTDTDTDSTSGAKDMMMMPRALTTPDLYTHHHHSTASTPSLRSRDPVDVADMQRPFTPLDGDGGNVKVVVRVRKHIKREIEAHQPCIVRMNPNTQETTIQPPELTDEQLRHSRKQHEEKSFTFDKSFWSQSEADPHFAGQSDIYNSFGEEFLDHNFDGYHTCIFAYGQTGSGKSYTMMGTPDQPGLIPRTCRGLFERVEAEQSGSITYNVHVSYFEIYNEHVKDLLTPRTNPPTYLKIRESKGEGVFVQNLTDEKVESYEDIEKIMKIGDLNRTVASTKMNDTSSRSHAVFTLTLKQIQAFVSDDSTTERVARMRLVDLAGSERAGRTEATGQRLREGGNINQSLTTLGRVIAALADPKRQRAARMTGLQNQTKRRAEVVPYRDSVLTWLLKDSLGGNSKTAMVACISPTDYDETLSTLRYADQAKRIRTKAHINQDNKSAAERDAQIMEMAETIKQLQLSVNTAATRKRDEADRARDELEDYQRQVGKMHRAMQESKAVSDTRIRALAQEVEELRPQNEALRVEIESLRRHLALAVGELKNPIVLPEAFMEDEDGERSVYGDSDHDSGVDEGFSYSDDHGKFELESWQADVDALLTSLGLFKKKVQDDTLRFPRPDSESEARTN